MKKILLFILCAAILCGALTVGALASEVAADNSAVGGENLPVAGDTTVDEAVDGTEGESGESAKKFYSEWIDKLTDSTMWINILSYLAGILGLIAFVKGQVGNIKGNVCTLLNGQLSVETVKSLIDEAVSASIAEYKSSYEAMRGKLEAQCESERTILSVLAIFISNAKINPYAKSEIMSLLTGAKSTLGSVEEAVTAANAAIEAARSAEEEIKTPALDEVLAAAVAAPYMELG